MTRLARILRSRGLRSAVILPVVTVTFVLVTINVVRACWEHVIVECFAPDHYPYPSAWPANDPPGEGNWRVCSICNGSQYCYPTVPPCGRWGLLTTSTYYDIALCPDDVQSLWCYGYPLGNDPVYNDYPANYDSYATYGPFSLQTATAARCLFRLYIQAEEHHDSLFWGASTQIPLTNALMKVGGSTWLPTDNWISEDMDLSNLRDYTTGDSVSLLGQSVVYVFFRFRSDGNNIRNVGAFIDNMDIVRDNGLLDVSPFPAPPAASVQVMHLDSTLVTQPISLGDTVMARFGWQICDGGIPVYDAFRVMLTLWPPEGSAQVLFDTTVAADTSGTMVTMFSHPWIATPALGWGEMIVRLTVDTLNQINEGPNENNNVDTATYDVFPPNPLPNFYWIQPSADTLWADTTVWLKYFLQDPEEPSWITIYYGNSAINCPVTPYVPDALDRPSIDGRDSVLWDVRSLPNNRTYWMWANYYDSQNDTCVRALGLVRICHACLGVSDHPVSSIPEQFFLEQNYPNPFNPVTEIRYGLAKGGHVSLRIFDLLGREEANLVNGVQTPGTYSAPFNGSKLATGIYMYVLTTPEGTISRKMMLLK